MPVAANKRPVYGYPDEQIKEQMREIKKADPRCTESWQVAEALRRALPDIRKEVLHPPKPRRRAPR